MLPTQNAPSGPTLPSFRRLVGGSSTRRVNSCTACVRGSNSTTRCRNATTSRPERQRPKLPTTSGKSHPARWPLSTDSALIRPLPISQNKSRRFAESQTGDSPTPQRESQTSSNAVSVMTVSCLSRAPDIPEHGIALQDARQIRLISCRHPVLAQRDVGNVLERLKLDLPRERLLSREVRRKEPGVAQCLDARTGGPPDRRGLAVAAQEDVTGRVDHVEAGPARVEDAPAALGHRFGFHAALYQCRPVHRRRFDLHP